MQIQHTNVRSIAQRAWRESGLLSVWTTGVDAWIIIAARTARMFAYGASSLVLALFFAELHVSDARIGLFMTLTLVGDVVLGLLLTLVADRAGRRRTLFLGSVLMVVSGAAFGLCENYWVLLFAAVVGVISATGGDFGPFRAVEESMLSEITTPETRADVLVWYVTTSALGTAAGTEMAGRAVHYMQSPVEEGGRGWSLLKAYHVCYWVYAAMGIGNLVLCVLLSKKTELHGTEAASIPLTPTPSRGSTRKAPLASPSPSSSASASSLASPSTSPGDSDSDSDGELDLALDDDDDDDDDDDASPGQTSRFSQISHQTRRVMYGLWFLLMVDSLADGMASIALTSYYLDWKFHPTKDSLGNILSASYVCSAVMSVFAGPLARYIGLVNTMVFTHVPSSAAVLLFPLPSGVPMSYALLLLRIALNSLDQAPRAALIAAVVKPDERTAVMGVTSLLRTLASTTGPSLTGLLAGQDRFWIAFVVAGALRLAYDFGLFAMFVNIRLYQHEPAAESTDAEYTSVPGHPDAFILDEEEAGGRRSQDST